MGLCYLGTNQTTQTGVQNVQGAIFLIVTENTFTPMYSILDDFPRNYPLFLREYKSGLYSAPIYFLSRIMSMVKWFSFKTVLIEEVKAITHSCILAADSFYEHDFPNSLFYIQTMYDIELNWKI